MSLSLPHQSPSKPDPAPRVENPSLPIRRPLKKRNETNFLYTELGSASVSNTVFYYNLDLSCLDLSIIDLSGGRGA